jgi:ubiquinone/menaquinone biosynthesis C-methylase UbiE
MRTEWDYSDLAEAYLKRPDYSDATIDAMLAIAGAKSGSMVCDVGAGVAHLTLMLAARGLDVIAVEPNDAMRARGIARTAKHTNVVWHEGVGENTGQSDHVFDIVTFGSSFNVCDRSKALKEAARILKPRGWFACMWNHRRLDDPLQASIESIIKDWVSGYNYGTRREDQSEVIRTSGLFDRLLHLDARIVHEQAVADCIEAWRSHATLAREAGNKFNAVVDAISEYLLSLKTDVIQIPYDTNIWLARLH